MGVNAGALDRRIELFQRVKTFDEYNAEVVNWVSLGRVWAEVQDVGGTEGLEAGLLTAEVSTRFKIRYRPDLRPDFTMRIEFDNNDYEVTRVSRLPQRGDGFYLWGRLLDRTGSRGL